MRELEIKKTITYRWWRDAHKHIPASHVPILMEKADQYIQWAMDQGNLSGSLNTSRHTPSHGYRRWWEIK